MSGAKDWRPSLNKLLADAKARKFDAIIVWKIDRFGRSLRHLVNTLADLEALGINLHLLARLAGLQHAERQAPIPRAGRRRAVRARADTGARGGGSSRGPEARSPLWSSSLRSGWEQSPTAARIRNDVAADHCSTESTEECLPESLRRAYAPHLTSRVLEGIDRGMWEGHPCFVFGGARWMTG